MQTYFVYVTAADKDEALRIGKQVVEARLAACANILGSSRSIYWWENSVQEAEEAVLILKTKESVLEELISAVREAHGYDCPCIVAIPIAAGDQAFLQWIRDETK
jgi:periplasmic divalent cation tolerance protein